MCFTIPWVIHVLIWLVVVCGFVAIVRFILPILLGWIGVAGDIVMKVLNILLAMFIIIVLLLFVLDLYQCAMRY